MTTKALLAAKAKVSGSDMESSFKDPLDAEGNDPEIVAQQLKEFKGTLMVKNDANLGVDENEGAFQETLSRFCEYLEPEYQEAIATENERQVGEFDEDALVERKWIPPDEFGEKGDFRTVGLAYSYEREKITSKIGIPGHPAPALQRWRQRKTTEAKSAHWTELPMSMEEVLSAEYDTEEAEEEAIIKILSVKYQQIEDRKAMLVGGETVDPAAKKKQMAAGSRKKAAPVVGTKHGMWSVLRHKFPTAPLFFPTKVAEGDKVIPYRGQTKSVFAWQRTLDRRAALERKVQLELASATSDVPKHRFRERLKKEDVDRCHEFIEKVLLSVRDGNNGNGNGKAKEHRPSKAYAKAASAASDSPSVKGSKEAKKEAKRAATAANKASSLGKRTGAAAEAEKKANEEAKEVKRRLKKEKEERKKEKEAKKLAKAEKAAVRKEVEQQRLAAVEEEEKAKRKSARGFLPTIKTGFGSRKKRGGGDDDDEDGSAAEESEKGRVLREKAEAEAVRVAAVLADDGAGWARTYRASFPSLISDDLKLQCEELLLSARAGEESIGTNLKKFRDAKLEDLTDEPAPFLTTKDLVNSCAEGNFETVAKCLAQQDPELNVDTFDVDDDSCRSPLFTCFKMLIEVERAQEEMLEQSRDGQVSKGVKAATKLNATLQSDLEVTMALLVCSSAEVDLSESSSGGGLGWTMLTHAVSLGNHKRVKQLLHEGVSVNVQDINERTPLMEASMKGHLAVADALIRSGARLFTRDSNGFTSLHYAAMFGRTAMCSALLIAGADKESRNKELETAAEVAVRRGHQRTNQAISTFYRDRVPVKRVLAELEADYLDGGRT